MFKFRSVISHLSSQINLIDSTIKFHQNQVDVAAKQVKEAETRKLAMLAAINILREQDGEGD